MISEETARRTRRRWSEDEKRRIVAQSYEPGMSVSKASRLHDLNANQLFAWRRRLKPKPPAVAEPAFAVIDLVSPRAAERSEGGVIEIEAPCGGKVRVGSDVDEAALTRVLRALRAAR